MARGEPGTIFEGFHGRFNDHIVIKHRNGKPILSLVHTIKARAYGLPYNYTEKEYMIHPGEA
jgi:hypothetical protein